MTRFHKVLLLFTVLFLVVDAKKDKKKQVFHTIPGFPKFLKPFPATVFDQGGVSDGGVTYKPDYETDNLGSWEVINPESGVSAMQIQLMPDNTMNVYDATVYRVSRLRYPEGMKCIQFYDENLKETKDDCFAHAMEYDLQTNKVRALTVRTIHISYFLTLHKSIKH